MTTMTMIEDDDNDNDDDDNDNDDDDNDDDDDDDNNNNFAPISHKVSQVVIWTCWTSTLSCRCSVLSAVDTWSITWSATCIRTITGTRGSRDPI